MYSQCYNAVLSPFSMYLMKDEPMTKDSFQYTLQKSICFPSVGMPKLMNKIYTQTEDVTFSSFLFYQLDVINQELKKDQKKKINLCHPSQLIKAKLQLNIVFNFQEAKILPF